MERNFPLPAHLCRLPAFVSWMAVSCGTALAFALPFRFCTAAMAATPFHYATASVLLIALALTGILVKRPVGRFVAFLLCALVLCTARRAHQVEVYGNLRPATDGSAQICFIGKVLLPPVQYYDGYSFLMRIDSASAKAAFRGLTVNCICPFAPPQYGAIQVQGVFAPPQPRRNPFEYDEFNAMMGRGIWGTVTCGKATVVAARKSLPESVASAFRNATLAALGKVADFDNRALLQASFLGDANISRRAEGRLPEIRHLSPHRNSGPQGRHADCRVLLLSAAAQA